MRTSGLDKKVFSRYNVGKGDRTMIKGIIGFFGFWAFLFALLFAPVLLIALFPITIILCCAAFGDAKDWITGRGAYSRPSRGSGNVHAGYRDGRGLFG